jgi:hypothetical protein
LSLGPFTRRKALSHTPGTVKLWEYPGIAGGLPNVDSGKSGPTPHSRHLFVLTSLPGNGLTAAEVLELYRFLISSPRSTCCLAVANSSAVKGPGLRRM